PCPLLRFAAIDRVASPNTNRNLQSSQGSKKHALSPHHAARAQSRCRAEILSGCAGAEGGPPHRKRQGPLYAGVSVRARRYRNAEETAADARRAAGRADLQLGRGEIRRGPIFRPSRL